MRLLPIAIFYSTLLCAQTDPYSYLLWDETCPERFKSAHLFEHGTAVVETETGWGVIDTACNWLVDNDLSHITRSPNGAYRLTKNDNTQGWFFPKSGKWLKPEFKRIISEDDGLVTWFDGEFYRVLDLEGESVLSASFAVLLGFSEGLCAAKKDKSDNFCCIDRSGSWVVPPNFKGIISFSDGLAAALGDNNLWGFIDASGEWKIQPMLPKPPFSGFKNGFAKTQDGRFFRANGTLVNLPSPNSSAKQVGNLIFFEKNGLWGWTDDSGKIWVEPKFDQVPQYHVDEKRVAVKIGGQWGFADFSGKIIVPTKYKIVSYFSEGLAVVEDFSGKHGYIDPFGNVVIPLEFDAAEPFKNGFSLVKKGDVFYKIDKKGKLEPVGFSGVFYGKKSFLSIGKRLDELFLESNSMGNQESSYPDWALFSEGKLKFRNLTGVGFLKNPRLATPENGVVEVFWQGWPAGSTVKVFDKGTPFRVAILSNEQPEIEWFLDDKSLGVAQKLDLLAPGFVFPTSLRLPHNGQKGSFGKLKIVVRTNSGVVESEMDCQFE